MIVERDKHFYSRILQRDMYFNVYGDRGKPCLVFPPQDGMHQDFEGFGMIDVLKPWIEAGRLKVYSVDSVDRMSWSATDRPLGERSMWQENYFRHIVEEFVPHVIGWSGERIITTGCSLGATHAALMVFRRPDIFDSCISMSGCFDARVLFDGQMDEVLYHSSPVDFLRGMSPDHHYLDTYKTCRIHIVIGQGSWEEQLLPGVRETDRICAEKGIPAFFDYWGFDVYHDWPWWKKMLPYHMQMIVPL
jgi:esterase/lipase superfamily enzyme